jgi:hypothetical protein
MPSGMTTPKTIGKVSLDPPPPPELDELELEDSLLATNETGTGFSTNNPSNLRSGMGPGRAKG